MMESIKCDTNEIETLSFTDLMNFMKYTFHHESTENIIEAIRQFESDTSPRGMFKWHDVQNFNNLLPDF